MTPYLVGAALLAVLYYIYELVQKQRREIETVRLEQKLATLIPIKKALRELNDGVEKARQDYEKKRDDFYSKFPVSNDPSDDGSAG